MVYDSLKDRINNYEQITDYYLLKKLPIIITLNGRGFKKTTSFLKKPYDDGFLKLIQETIIKLLSDIEGAVFAYSFNDEINIVCKNDQTINTEAWYNNNIQKIASASASIASIAFYNSALKNNIKLLGDPVFIAKVFAVPNLIEVNNYLIAKQNECSNIAISMLCFYELLKNNNAKRVAEILKDLSGEEKYNLLINDFKIDPTSYPLSFWRGIACYRVPKHIKTDYGLELKYKLTINDQLTLFHKDQSFLQNILKK